MKLTPKYVLAAVLLTAGLASCKDDTQEPDNSFEATALREADGLLNEAARLAGISKEARKLRAASPGPPSGQNRAFTHSHHFSLPS